jgi:glycosyltransferase involved in cell wall biosynthesis
MARIMMIISPGKRSNYMKMVASFSSHLETLLFTPAYPSVDRNIMIPASETLQQKLLGDAGLRKAMKEFEPDLIFTDAALYGLQAKTHLLRSGRRTPFLVHLLGDWWREYWSWFASSPWHKRTFGTQQFAYNWIGLALAKEILPVCKWLDHVTRCHLPGKRTEVVYMAVDPGEFHELPGMHLEKPAVAIIQNHTVFPKVQGLLGLRRIVDKLPQVHFYVAEGQPIAQQYLTLVKSTYASSPNVHFVEGIHTPERVRMMLTAADCYVLASELDCCPTTVLEASLL